jgi:glycerol-3-phosphate cytidylyltransferase-like family protein
MSNYSYQYRQTLHKTLLSFATDSSNTDTILAILKEYNEQIVIVKDDISFDVSKLNDKTIICLNKFLMI